MDIQQILIKYWGLQRFQADAGRYYQVGFGRARHPCINANRRREIHLLSSAGSCKRGYMYCDFSTHSSDERSGGQTKGIRINAFAIYSGMHQTEIELALNNATLGNAKLLYISPERLATPNFREVLRYMKVNLIAVDEAHCISQWGVMTLDRHI